MIILASSKGQDFTPAATTPSPTLPEFFEQAHALIALLRHYSLPDLRSLMQVSQDLAAQTLARIHSFSLSRTPENSKPAILAFSGEAYRSLAAMDWTPEELRFAQDRIRILSGLYGSLRPLDLIQPYRLEMGTSLPNAQGKTLYPFWSDLVTASLNRAMAKERHPMLINLASNEYAKVVQKKRLHGPWLDIQFMEETNGRLKSVAVFAKRARGLMAGFCIRNRIERPEDLRHFTGSGYTFRPDLSNEHQWLFTRPQP